MIVLHHTVSAPAPPASELRTIQQDHLERGFTDIGYHFLVDRPSYADGRDIYWGRQPLPDGALSVGAHSRGHNHDSIGVALLGDYDTDEPSPRQLQSLVDLLAWLCFAWDIPPDHIVPHSALNPTACPGKALQALLPRLRWQVAWRLRGLAGEPPVQPPEGRPDAVRVLVGGSTLEGRPRQGVVWVPVRPLASSLGRRVEWDGDSRTAAVVAPLLT